MEHIPYPCHFPCLVSPPEIFRLLNMLVWRKIELCNSVVYILSNFLISDCKNILIWSKQRTRRYTGQLFANPKFLTLHPLIWYQESPQGSQLIGPSSQHLVSIRKGEARTEKVKSMPVEQLRQFTKTHFHPYVWATRIKGELKRKFLLMQMSSNFVW